MRRDLLPPPGPLRVDVDTWPAVWPVGGPQGIGTLPSRAAGGTVPRDPLTGPAPARERLRRLFHPRRGWLRRLERWASHRLTARVYPWIPGMHRPYGRVLRRRLTLSEAEVALPGLAAPFEGTRLLLITDVHAGPFVAPRLLGEIFERLQACRPDAILLGGDLITARTAEFLEHREAFRRLRAPLGLFAVLGNHDHYPRRPARLRQLMEETGITVLHNRSVRLSRGGASLTLSGVDDLLMGAPDLDAALRCARPPVVLLSHNPDLLFEAARRGVALMLSGHTHAGQIRVRGLPVLVRQSRYRLDQGRYRAAGTELVVSRGLGAVGLPWRANCPPEAVLLRLRAGV